MMVCLAIIALIGRNIVVKFTIYILYIYYIYVNARNPLWRLEVNVTVPHLVS